MDKTVTITDRDGQRPRFTQWETDRELVIAGCASAPLLRFGHPALRRALVVAAEEESGDAEDQSAGSGESAAARWLCRVPNSLLQLEGPLFISVFEQAEGGEGKETAFLKTGIRPRLKPQDYCYEENIGYVNWVQKSAEAQAFLDRFPACEQAMEEAVERAAESAQSAAGSSREAQNALSAAQTARAEAGEARDAARSARDDARTAQRDAQRQAAEAGASERNAADCAAAAAQSEAQAQSLAAAAGEHAAAAVGAAAAAESASESAGQDAAACRNDRSAAAESASAAAGSAAAAAEVLASIPEDYTALADDVRDLKPAFENVKINLFEGTQLLDYAVRDLNYGANPGASDSNCLSVVRRGSRIVLNGGNINNESRPNVFVKLTGSTTGRTNNSLTVRTWADGITLKNGRTYRATVVYVSGESSSENAPPAVTVSVYTLGQSATIGYGTRDGNGRYIRYFTAAGELNLCLFVPCYQIAYTDYTVDVILEEVDEAVGVHLPSMVTNRALAVNDFRIVDNELFRVTAPVASGDFLIPGTNCVKTTVTEVLTQILK